MRRAIIIITALLIGFCTAAVVYSAYINSEEDLKFDDVESKNLTISSSGYFEGEFRSELKGKELCGYDYEVSGKKLYISLQVTAGTKRELLPTNDSGFTKIRIKVGSNVDKIYYRVDDDEDKLDFTKP